MKLRITHALMLPCLLAGSAYGQFNLNSSGNPSVVGQSITLTTDPLPFPTSVNFMDGGANGTLLGSAVTGSANVASLTISTLSAGAHPLVACYSFNTTCSMMLNQVVNRVPSTIAITSAPNPSVVGQPVTLTATVGPAGATGSVFFYLDGSIDTIGSAALASGKAIFTTSTLTAGPHSLSAQYSGDSTFAFHLSDPIAQTVTAAGPATTTLTLSSSQNPSSVGQSISIRATITPASAIGSVTFFDGGVSIGTTLLTPFGNTEFAVFLTSTLAAGSHTLTAAYGGNASFGPSNAPSLVQVVGSALPTITIGNNPPATVFTPQGQSFTPSIPGNRGTGTPPAGGSVQLTAFSFDFQTPTTAPPSLYIYASAPTVAQVNNNGQGSLGLGVNNGVGVYSFANLVLDVNTKYFAVLSASANIFEGPGNSYSGGADMFAQPQSAPTSILEGSLDTGFTATFQAGNQGPAATTTTLSVSPAASTFGQTVTLNATVLPSSATGIVNFMDGGISQGTANLTGGTASFIISTLAVGNHSLTAAYGGSTVFGASASAPFIESVSSSGPSGAWTVSQSHITNFSAAQPLAFFTVTAMNTQGSGSTSGPVTVTDFPAGNVIAFSMSGANWNCLGNACSRSDALAVGSSYPPITVSVTLASDASTQLTNQVSITGGGLSQSFANDTANIIPAFTDILSNDSFLPFIDLLRESGITTGCTPTTYCENDNITQAQMAVFVVRSVMGGDSFFFTAAPYFSDVAPSNLYFKWIQKMQDLGIALSCSSTQFCPDSAVTRAQMAVLIIRGRYGLSVPPNFPGTQLFSDVPTTYPYFSWIQKMKQVGITTGCSPTTYCPDTPVTRGQMAVFIMRGMFNLGLPAGTPLLNSAPLVTLLGQSVEVTIQAQNSNFLAGVTTVSAGPGITVNSVNVSNGTTLTAMFVVSPNAAPGPRSILVTTGAEEGTLPNVFTMSVPLTLSVDSPGGSR